MLILFFFGLSLLAETDCCCTRNYALIMRLNCCYQISAVYAERGADIRGPRRVM